MAEEFFGDYLVHVKGEWAGQPLKLEKWQRDEIVRPLFGWKIKCGAKCKGTKCDAFHPRKYRVVYIEVPRKNGKSTLGAGVALKLFTADGEQGAEVYSAAADRDQAAIVFGVAKEMVGRSPELSAMTETFVRSIVRRDTASTYKVLSADAPTKHGLNSHGVLFDELHAQPNRDLYDVLTTSTGSRRQPITFIITTAGYDKHSICYEVHDYAMKVKSGTIQDESLLAVIYAADEGDDWKDPKTWKKANPNLGVSVKMEYLEAACNRAQEIPAYENTFKRLHLNIWTEQETRWLAMDSWNACDFQVGELGGETCYAGLDLASTSDIAAFVLLFSGGEKPWPILPFFWIPEENIIKRSRKDKVPYDVWAAQGMIRATPGNIIDYDVIRHDVGELAERYRILECAFDPWNSSQITTQLGDDGLTMVKHRQGFASMSAPTKELEKLVLAREIAHGGNEVLRWMASNVSVKQDPAGNLKPDKSKSTEKIDGIVALVMAVSRATSQSVSSSVYEEREVVVI